MFENILVSSPNDGGIFFIDGKIRHKISAHGSTGLFYESGKFLHSTQPQSIRLIDITNSANTFCSPALHDIHDVIFYEGHIFAVATSSNEIIKLTTHGELIERWRLPGEADSSHVNSIALWNDRLVFSAFGDFRTHRGYKGFTSRSGFVKDLITGKTLISDLSEPHSLAPNGPNLFLANSREKQIIEFSEDGSVIRLKQLDAYTRGILITDSAIYVGLSKSRNLEDAKIESASVVALDPLTLDELDRVTIPANEIYGIQQIQNDRHLSQIIAGVGAASLRETTRELAEKATLAKGYEERVTSLTDQVASLTDQIASLADQIFSLNAEKTALADKVNALLHSDSWRVAAPLRAAKRWLRDRT